MRIYTTFSQFITGLQHLSVNYLDTGAVRNQICLGLTGFFVSNDNLTLLLCITQLGFSTKLCDNGKTLGLSCLEKLLDTGKTLCDIVTGDTTTVEGSHGKLCTGLTDRLCSDDSDCFTYLYCLASSHVCAVALCTDTYVGTAGQDGTNLYFLNGISVLIHASAQNPCGTAGRNHMVVLYNHLTVFIVNILAGISSCDSVL